MYRPLATISTVDIMGINSYQRDPGVAQPSRDLPSEVREAFKVLVRAPMRVPSCVDEYRFAAEIGRRQR